MRLSNMLLQRVLDEAAEEDKKKKEEEEKKAKEQEAEEKPEDNPDETPEEDAGEGEEEQQDGEAEDAGAEDAEGEEPPAEDGETPPEEESESEGDPGTDGDGGDAAEGADGGGGDTMDDFSLDGDDPAGGEEDLGPAPDGLPEADDDGSGDTGEDEDPDGETNIQTNILNLSKLDRALAKKAIGANLVDLRSTIIAAIGVIDRNDAIIDPDVRDIATDKLNSLHGDLESFILHKFPILNYEDSLTQYLVFAKKVNDAVEYVKSDGIKGRKD